MAIKLVNKLSCVVIAFGKSCQEIMDVQSRLLLLGVLPDIKIMVAERKGLADWSNVASTPEGVPSRSAAEGHEGSTLKV